MGVVGSEYCDTWAPSALRPTASGQQRAIGCERHAVDAAIVAEVEQHLVVTKVAVVADRVCAEFAARLRWRHVGLGYVERAFVVAQQHTVGTGRVERRPLDQVAVAVRNGDQDGLVIELHHGLVGVVTRVAEPNPPIGPDREIVRGIEARALESVSDDRARTIRLIALDATSTVDTAVQPSVGVECEADRLLGVVEEHHCFTGAWVEGQDPARRHVGEDHPLAIPHRALGE